jgi:RimJ/RimL family protein N-acetyltransferase
MFIFETERLIVRKFVIEDTAALFAYLSDPEVVKFEPYPPFNLADCQAECLARVTDERFYAVCLKTDGTLIGHLYAAVQSEKFATWIFGYVFNRSYHGHGYATDAARGLLGYLFYHRHARRIIAKCDPLNTPSWKLLERLGMRREAHHKQEVFFQHDILGQPIWKDTFVYAMLRGEWEKTQN